MLLVIHVIHVRFISPLKAQTSNSGNVNSVCRKIFNTVVLTKDLIMTVYISNQDMILMHAMIPYLLSYIADFIKEKTFLFATFAILQ